MRKRNILFGPVFAIQTVKVDCPQKLISLKCAFEKTIHVLYVLSTVLAIWFKSISFSFTS